jgi:hypothetical protein
MICLLAATLSLAACRDRGQQRVTVELDSMALDALRTIGRPQAQHVPGTIADVTYHTEYNLTNRSLVVWPRDGGAAVTIAGKKITATYFHMGRLLVVETVKGEGPQETTTWDYFTEPAHWSSVPN